MKKDKDLEELDKTTDLLKAFKPRVSDEEKTENLEDLINEWRSDKKVEKKEVTKKTEENKVEPKKVSKMDLSYIDDDKTLELSDVELDKTVKFDKTEDVNSFIEEIKKEVKTEEKVETLDVEEKLNEGLDKRQKLKIYGMRLTFVSLFFLPGIISLIIIGTHSNELVTKILFEALTGFAGFFTGTLIVGLILYIKNYQIETIRKVKAIYKYIYSFFMVFYVMGCITILFLLYGPVNSFRDWLVTTAMATKDHHYYCTWFYNDKEIEEVFSRNYIKETGESTDEDLINVNSSPSDKEVYANEYEKAVLTKEEGNEDYKIINFEVNGCKAYLAVIYDPSKVRVTTTDKVGVRGQYVTTMAKRENALVAINGAGFYDPGYSSSGGSPRGITIANGKIVTNNEYGAVSVGGLIGFNKDNKLVLLKNVTAKQALDRGIRDAVSWGPFLIVNGKPSYTKGNGGWGYAARTAIGQRADGIVLFLVVDSNYNRTKGANMVDMTEIMQRYGAINATNLDGGTSSVMVVNGKMISHPIDSSLQNETRPIATSFIATK